MLFQAFHVLLKTYQVKRRAEGHYDNGLWIEGQEQQITIRGSLQPTEAEVLETLPEGYRTRENYTLYTEVELFTSETNKTNPDVVMVDGEKYQVVKVIKWRDITIPYFECLIVRENIDAD
jgi:hypothetical protein